MTSLQVVWLILRGKLGNAELEKDPSVGNFRVEK
jgi:hypothetical protein